MTADTSFLDYHFAGVGKMIGIGRKQGLQRGRQAKKMNVRDWAPNIDNWPKSWMGVEEDLEYGKKLLPYLEEFLQSLIEEGKSRKTFVQYRDNAWLLGGTIISQVSRFDEYGIEPLEKLSEAVAGDGILPDHYDQLSESELNSFERMCRRFEKFLAGEYGALGYG